MRKIKRILVLISVLTLISSALTGCSYISYELSDESGVVNTDSSTDIKENAGTSDSEMTGNDAESTVIEEDGIYTSKDDVALYIHTYGKLPSNFMTKSEAKKLGWSGGSLEDYAEGMCIGGDYFGNYEGSLPTVKGREYHECDIDTLGKNSRGAKRIIYANDGWIYYTEDHYETFETLYEGEK